MAWSRHRYNERHGTTQNEAKQFCRHVRNSRCNTPHTYMFNDVWHVYVVTGAVNRVLSLWYVHVIAEKFEKLNRCTPVQVLCASKTACYVWALICASESTQRWEYSGRLRFFTTLYFSKNDQRSHSFEKSKNIFCGTHDTRYKVHHTMVWQTKQSRVVEKKPCSHPFCCVCDLPHQNLDKGT